jgi:predicted nucleic acid-binding protein
MLYVLDANVVVRWFTPEPFWEHAIRLLNPGNRFVVPDFMPTEVMNAMLRKYRKGEVDEQDVHIAQRDIKDAFDLVASEPLLDRAVRLSIDNQRDAFDGVYVALALDLGCQFVTGDGPLYRSLATRFRQTMLWVEDIPA